ncbi:MAG: glycoside hydrolase family 31 protein [Flavobacteriaceae bacterium]
MKIHRIINQKYLVLTSLFLVFLSSAAFGQEVLNWKEVQNGIWHTTIGKRQKITLLKAADTSPNEKGLNTLSRVDFPLDKAKINAKVIKGKTYLRFPLHKEEELFGLGLNFKTHNQRGRILNLHVDHYGKSDNGRTHAPVPFYISTEGYGVLIDAANYITVYAGTGIRIDADDKPVLRNRNSNPEWEAQPYSDAVEILVPADGTEVYVFGGRSMLEVVQRYNLFSGGGYLPPKWGLGFTQRVLTLYSAKDILKEVSEFEDHDFPLNFIGVEPGWQTMSYPCTFEWEKTRFPEPKKFIDELLDKGIRANLWLNPYVSPVGGLYKKVKPFSGSHTVWNGIVPDLTLEETRALFKEHFYKTI